MNRARKVDLLYRRAKGQSMNATQAEVQELARYKVRFGENQRLATKTNIESYVRAVDSGSCKVSFEDYCWNNGKADRRRKGGSEEAIVSERKQQNVGAVFIGWLTWGLALYWLLGVEGDAGPCAVMGAVISVICYVCARRLAGITLFILPLVLAVVGYMIH